MLIAAAASALFLHVAAASNNDSGTSNNVLLKMLYQPRHAPARPADAPDVEYENHPFDRYRHLYDDNENHERGKRRGNDSKSSQQHSNDTGLRKRMRFSSRWGNNNNEEEEKDSTIIYHARETQDNNNNVQSDNNNNSIPPTTTTTTTLDPTTDSLYQPLRIQFDVRHLINEMDLARSSGNNVVLTKLQLLIYEVLPMTAQAWGDLLRVIPVKGGIYPLAAKGSSAEAWLPNDTNGDEGSTTEQDDASSTFINEDGTTTTTTTTESILYEDPVRAFYCPDETTSGISGGADLLIYATVNRHCGGELYLNRNRRRRTGVNHHAAHNEAGGGGGTLASALSCQRDQYDRPITGSIDFCLSGMDGTSSVDVDEAISQKEAQGFGPSPNDNGENVIVGSNGASLTWNGWFGKSMDQESPLKSNVDIVQYTAGVAIHGEFLQFIFGQEVILGLYSFSSHELFTTSHFFCFGRNWPRPWNIIRQPLLLSSSYHRLSTHSSPIHIE